MRLKFSRLLFPVLALGFTACAEQQATAEPARQASEPHADVVERSMTGAEVAVALDSEGLRLVDTETGRTRLLAFGTDRETTEKILAAHLGSVEGRSSIEECGAGPMDFSALGDLTANFQDDQFVGWSVRGGDPERPFTTISGIGPGTSRSEMGESLVFEIYEDSSLGTEFYTGGEDTNGFSGLLASEETDAKITDLWAGTNCIFR